MSKVAFVSVLSVLSAMPALAEPIAQPKVFSILGAEDISAFAHQQPSATMIAAETDQPTRSEIALNMALDPGTIVVKTAERKLYFVEPNNRAIMWRVAVGRQGFAWKGTNTITRMAEWPDWRPPPEMLQREAANGHIIPDFMKGGSNNPLGSRALYLGDSAYRIHGTNQPWTIGQANSSGC
ncbi:MAG: L,D-transpeptidase, partial [Aestuariivirga sp.]